MPDTLPVHQTEVRGFWMDETTVTNAQFAKFVSEKGYVTVAEKVPKQEDYPDAPKGTLFAGSAVFNPPAEVKSLSNPYAWWKYVAGAYWRHPEGPDSSVEKRRDHPAVHIAYEDAETFCRLNGKRLPTEAEYEYAARGGLHLNRYSWGNELKPNGKWAANIWQGEFPTKNRGEDGYLRTSPVKAFPPNGFGLYDMGETSGSGRRIGIVPIPTRPSSPKASR